VNKDTTVVGYYPGGGGNRYFRYTQEREFEKFDTAYDQYNLYPEYRYLTTELEFPLKSPIILTHCLNAERIKNTIGACDIVFILSDFKKSLLREWILNGHSRYKERINSGNDPEEHTKINSAWATIVWHHDYYKKFPIDVMDHAIIDLSADKDKFSQLMNEELDRYHCEIFDFCWNIYTTQGKNAPIVSLYARHISEQNSYR
jgi:hypothetical protein